MVMSSQHWHVLLGIRDREIRIPRDMNTATLGQSANRDISIPSVAIRVEHLSVLECRVGQRCTQPYWRDRQIYLEREYLVGTITLSSRNHK